jgi:hypothetical protein
VIFKKFVVEACCKKVVVIYKLGAPMTESLLDYFISNGFSALAHFRIKGMIYAQNGSITLTGPLGANRLHVKCEKDQCNQALIDLEALIDKF